MILFDGEKYACLRCIRGHRSSTCTHKDRPLLQVRRPGRPSNPDTRVAIIPDEHSSYIQRGPNQIEIDPNRHTKKLVDTSGGEVKIIGDVPEAFEDVETASTSSKKRRPSSSSSTEGGMEDGKITKKRVCECECDGNDDENKSNNNDNKPNGDTKDGRGSCCGNKDKLSKQPRNRATLKVRKRPENDDVYIPVGNGLYRKITREEYHNHKNAYDEVLRAEEQRVIDNDNDDDHDNNKIDGYAFQETLRRQRETRDHAPPMLIAPMELEGSMLDESQHEDLYYNASCLLGDCKCGDDCACDGCPIHDPKANKTLDPNLPMSNGYDESSYHNSKALVVDLPPANAPDRLGDVYCPMGNPNHLRMQRERLKKGLPAMESYEPLHLLSKMEEDLLNSQAIGRDN